jgi:hypothetical protein
VQLVEQLGLQNPFLLFAAATEAVDAVAERAVAFAVEHLGDVGGETAVGLGPGDAFVEIDEVAFVDARGRGVDDDKHFRREIFATSVEDHAGDTDGFGLFGVGAHVELERGEAVLSVDDEKLLGGLLEFSHAGAVGPGFEV